MYNRKNRTNYSYIYPAFIFLLLYCFFIFSCSEKNNRQDAFDFTLDELLKIDKRLICFDQTGIIPLPFTSPGAIASGPDGMIYITGDRKLIIIEENGTLIDQMKLDDKAYALAVSREKYVYVGYADYIEKIDLRTNSRFKWVSLESMEEGGFPGNHALITSIAAGSDYVFVADAGNHAVLCYDKKGMLVKRITGEETNKTPHFIVPSPYFDVAVQPDDSFLIVNPGRHRIEHWTVKGTLLKTAIGSQQMLRSKYIGSWGRPGGKIDEFCGCCNPAHIALFPPDDKGGTAIVTAEKGIPRVKLYSDTGVFQCVVAPPDLFQIGTPGLDCAVSNKGSVYILDPEKKLVRIFEARGDNHEKE